MQFIHIFQQDPQVQKRQNLDHIPCKGSCIGHLFHNKLQKSVHFLKQKNIYIIQHGVTV